VYVADRKCVGAYRANNFDLQGWHDHGDDEVIVALGSDVSRKRAIKTLQHVIKRIEYEIESGDADTKHAISAAIVIFVLAHGMWLTAEVALIQAARIQRQAIR
jgi:hypothetical protein